MDTTKLTTLINRHMKYSIILISFVILLTLSCKKDTEYTVTKASGLIKAQGITTYMYGTHILTDKAGNTLYALRGSSATLDNYIDKNVELEGHKVKGYPVDGGPEYIDVSKIK